MKLVQTLMVRDEVDIVDAQISYHRNAGVDFVRNGSRLARRNHRDSRGLRISAST